MVTFIDDYRAVYGVEPICKVLPIVLSTYYAHKAREREPRWAPPRMRRDAQLRGEIRRVWDEHFRVYGVRKVWHQLRRQGFRVARCTVERLMRDMGLQGVVRGKSVKTTVRDAAQPCPRDRVQRIFAAARPNQIWMADFTFVATTS